VLILGGAVEERAENEDADHNALLKVGPEIMTIRRARFELP
jgi:hypothetical protein